LTHFSTAAAEGGMVVFGTAVGAAVGSIIPGLGTAIGAGIGAGIGGLTALLFGDDVGKVISDLLDGSAAFRAGTENLEEATSKYETTIKKDNNVKGLIKEYGELINTISAGIPGSDTVLQAQANIVKVVDELARLYPELNLQYKKENDLLKEKIDLIETLSGTTKAESELELQFQINEARLDLIGSKEILDASRAEEAYQVDLANQLTKMHGDFLADYTKLRMIFQEREHLSYDDPDYAKKNEDLSNKIMTETNEIADKYRSAGLIDLANKIEYNPFEALLFATSEYEVQARHAIAAVNYETGVQAEIWKKLDAAYDAQRALIEGELGDTMEDLAGKFHTLDADGQAAFLNAISKMSNFTRQFEIESKKWKVDIEVNWPELMQGSRPGGSSPPKTDYHEYSPNPFYGAEGGITTRPRLSIWGEDGAEALIPLSAKHRRRGLALWERAGEMMGIGKYAEGGISSSPIVASPVAPSPIVPVPIKTGGTPAETDGIYVPVTVEGVNFEVHIDGGVTDEASIISILKNNIKDLTDEIAQKLAIAIQQVFDNLPMAAEA
jgi:gas vesicle protein